MPLAKFSGSAVDMVNGKSAPKYIVLCDKDHIGLVQRVIRITLSGQIGIQQTAVISCPLCNGSTVTALPLDIVQDEALPTTFGQTA